MSGMKHVIAIVALLLVSGYGLYHFNSNPAVGGDGTIYQLNQWRSLSGYITQNTTNTLIKLTGYESAGDCLVTNASGVVSTSTCGGGGSSKWESVGGFLQPLVAYVNDSIRGSTFTATSTTASSTFPNVKTNKIQADTSAGVAVYSNSGAAIADFGAGGGSNGTFFGGLNIDGQTRIATSITGMVKAVAGVLSAAVAGTDYLATTTPWTVGNATYVASNGAIGSVATGTLTESVTGLTLSNSTRGLFGGSAALSLDGGYTIPLTNSLLTASASTTGNLAFWSGNQTIGNVATGTLTETVTGLEFNATRSLVGGAAIMSLTSGYVIPTSTLWTLVSDYYQVPARRISLGAGLGWTSNTINSSTTPAFNIASTTLDGNGRQFSTATATFLLRNVPNATTLASWYCKASSTGSVMVRFGDGTNWTNVASCSTTGARVTASTNNTFTADEDFMVQIGSSASSPSRVTLTTSINNF